MGILVKGKGGGSREGGLARSWEGRMVAGFVWVGRVVYWVWYCVAMCGEWVCRDSGKQ